MKSCGLTKISGFALLGFLLILILPNSHTFASPVQVGHVDAELLSEVNSIKPGQPFWVGLKLRLDDNWHVYWRNPGDAGAPPAIAWSLPDGFTAEEMLWPYPERIFLGPLANYGYEKEVVFPIMITPAETITEKSVTLKAEVDWLVCREACIPGNTELSLDLNIASNSPKYNSENSALIMQSPEKIPIENGDWKTNLTWSDDNLRITLIPPDWHHQHLADILFFPFMRGIINHAGEQKLDQIEGTYRLTIPRDLSVAAQPEILEGILVSKEGWSGPGSEHAMAVSIGTDDTTPIAAASHSSVASIWAAILFAFLGGLILNLMPCVLPVLSLKILGFVQQSGESRRKSLGHGLIFTAGVLVSFLILAGLLLTLQTGGESLGWGFQLQSPVFLMILSGFLFLFGLNMLGVFEIGTSLTSVGAARMSRGGWTGSFLTGVTATIVATPCTAPFMGSALGYSLSQPPLIAMIIFTALGLGMASPYIIFSAFPGLLKFLPKPGAWMETLKQVMGFLLIGTVLWLAWVLSIQAGSTAVIALLGVLFLLGLGAWILGKWGHLAANIKKRTLAYSFFTILIAGGIGLGIFGISLSAPPSGSTNHSNSALRWEEYSPEIVEELRAAGKPVFIDFTAAWCLSCQVNERVALESEKVVLKFAELGVIPIKADWTSRNDLITAALAEFGRNSVPLYILYGANSNVPIVLPEIITPGIVLDALSKIN